MNANQSLPEEIMNENKKLTLDRAVELYSREKGIASPPRSLGNLKTVLKKMVLPGLGFDDKALKNVNKCLAKISLKLFAIEARKIYEEAEALALKAGQNKGTLKNNRSHLMRFIKWMESQDWYQEVVQPTDIPKYAPPMRKYGVNRDKIRRGRKRAGAKSYGLKEKELTAFLISQIGSLHSYLTNQWLRKQKGDMAVKEITWKGYKKCILWFLGYLKNQIGFSLEELTITLMADKETLNEYINWHFTEKGNGYCHARQTAITALNIAKWKDGKSSKLRNYADCLEVLEIREIVDSLSSSVKTDRRTTSVEALSEKLLSLEQCQQIVEHLRCCCAERTHDGNKRPKNAIIDSWQDYLMAAILTYTPVRQREIRELQIGKNLRRDEDGWWVSLTPEGHKTGSKTGKGREYPLFPCHLKERLTHDLDLYISRWRPLANLSHDYLFFMPGGITNREIRGEPIPDSHALSQSIPNLFFKSSAYLFGEENAKDPSPHDFRRIFATWVCKYGTPEEVAIYAEIMGHSVDVLLKTYQQCSSRDKTEQAEAAFAKIKQQEAIHKQEKEKKAIPNLAATPQIPPAVMAILTLEQKQKLIDRGLL